jgi:hypothetical protein
MFSAAMPEASIHENNHALCTEHEVSRAAHTRNHLCVRAVAKAQRMNGAPHGELGGGVTFSVALHRTSCGW